MFRKTISYFLSVGTPKIGYIFYDRKEMCYYILSKIIDDGMKLVFCTLANYISFKCKCFAIYPYEMNLNNLTLAGNCKALVPQEAKIDNIKVNDVLITSNGMVFVIGINYRNGIITCVDKNMYFLLYELGKCNLFKFNCIIQTYELEDIFNKISLRCCNVPKIPTKKIYKMYNYNSFYKSGYTAYELAAAALSNACKLQMKRNKLLQGKLDVSKLVFTNCVKFNNPIMSSY